MSDPPRRRRLAAAYPGPVLIDLDLVHLRARPFEPVPTEGQLSGGIPCDPSGSNMTLNPPRTAAAATTPGIVDDGVGDPTMRRKNQQRGTTG